MLQSNYFCRSFGVGLGGGGWQVFRRSFADGILDCRFCAVSLRLFGGLQKHAHLSCKTQSVLQFLADWAPGPLLHVRPLQSAKRTAKNPQTRLCKTHCVLQIFCRFGSRGPHPGPITAIQPASNLQAVRKDALNSNTTRKTHKPLNSQRHIP